MNKIKEIREAKGMSLDKVALACVPPTTAKQIQRLEKGERRLTTDWIERVAKALGCEPGDIVPKLSTSSEKNLYDILEEAHQKFTDNKNELAASLIKSLMEEEKK